MITTVDRTEFAANRRTAQDDAIDALLPAVEAALSTYREDESWWRQLLAPVRDLFNTTLAADSGGDVRRDVRAWSALSAAIRRTLPHTTPPDQYTAQRLATWLAVAAINAASLSAADHEPEPVLVEWVTMHDEKVRHAHAETDGQQRPPGETFDVEGHPMRYPGDPRAPLDLWLNCRCVVRPTSVDLSVAAGERGAFAASDPGVSVESGTPPGSRRQGRAVVALPAPGSQAAELVAALSKDGAHLTLVYLGTAEENPDLDMSAVRAGVAQFARQARPMTTPVGQIAALESATVWMLDEDEPTWMRSDVLRAKEIRAGYEAIKQWPKFRPHVSIGYDLDGLPAEAEAVASITFDRIAVWDGPQRDTYWLGAEMSESTTAAVETEPPISRPEPLAWHGVLAPEDVWSGDGRRFAGGSLRFRDLPLPLTWQKVSADGHDGSTVIARIENIERVEGMMRGSGHFIDTPETDEAVGMISEFGRFGVSVDADDAEFEFEEAAEHEHGGKVTFTSARIASASMVAIPAFAEAFIALGDWETEPIEAEVEPQIEPEPVASSVTDQFVSDKPWSDFTAADYSDEQWYAACVLHKNGTSRAKSDNGLPIKEPSGALNRNAVHAAASRFNQVSAPAPAKKAAAAALRGAYAKLGEQPPEVIKAVAESEPFKRGPGWVTNPEDTRRIHDYWTKPGHKGYQEINWGVPGDFNRCRVLVGEKIAKNSPEDTRFLNQICAQWHHDAIGYWPGRAPTEKAAVVPVMEGVVAPALSLVAALPVAPAAWFANPNLPGPAPLTITEDGRVFGHLAAWDTCHIGFDGVCVAPPASASGYAYFLTGEVLSDAGPIPVGQVTLGGGHAASGLGMRAALAHYDSTSAVVADVGCGEDEHGIWLAGMVRPGTDDETVYALRASAPSGDWRRVGGQMELIAALAVNAPGFPVPRAGVRNTEQVSLVASGVIGEPAAAGPDPLATSIVAAIEAWAGRRRKMDALAAKVARTDVVGGR